MNEAGETQKSLAPKIGMARPTLNVILNASDGKNLWRLPSLCAVSRALGVGVMDLFRALDAGEKEDDDRSAELREKALLATRAGSPERLRRLIRRGLIFFSALSGAQKDKELLERDDWERYLRCAPLEIQQGAPEFWADYTSLKLSNVDVVGAALTSFSYMEKHGGAEKLPFWVALKNTYRAQ